MRRLAGLGLLAVLSLLVAAAAYGVSQWRSQERSDAERTFRERAGVAAAQLESIMANSLPALGASLRRAGADGAVDPAELQRIAGSNAPIWLLDSHGRVDVSSPAADGAPEQRFREALERGRAAISGVILGPNGGRQIRIAVPLTGDERHVGIVATFPLAFAGGFIGSAIDRIPATTGSRAAVIDGEGHVLASAGLDDQVTTELAARAVSRRYGTLTAEGRKRVFASAPVAGTPWSVAIAAPESELYASVHGPAGWASWAAVLGFAVTGLAGIALLMRVMRDTERLEEFSRDLERRREEAESANRTKNEFISTIAHELRTPLAAIRMFVDLMRNDEDDPLSPAQQRNLDDIAASTNHVMELLEDTMDIARVEQGRLELRPERVSVAALAIGVVDGLHPLAAQRDVELSLEADGETGEVFLDPARLRQVMINLLSNALKFTPAGGSATMRIGRHGSSSFVISVEDTGIGIAAEALPRVFTAAGPTTKPVREQDSSRGLGLTLTRRIVEAMGGHVGVESELGKGSTFYAVLPRVNAGRRAGVDPTESGLDHAVRHDPAPGAEGEQRFSAVGVRHAPRRDEVASDAAGDGSGAERAERESPGEVPGPSAGDAAPEAGVDRAAGR